MSTQKPNKHPNRPIPEAISGKPWTVRIQRNSFGAEPEGWTDVESGEMALPPDDAENAEFVRLHELMHAAISPSIKHVQFCAKNKILRQDLQVCEDLRVHTALARKRLLPNDIRTSRRETIARLANDIASSDDKHAVLETYSHLILQHVVAVPRGLSAHGRIYEDYEAVTNGVITMLSSKPGALTDDEHYELRTIASSIAMKVGKEMAKCKLEEIPEFKRTVKCAKLLRKLLTQAHQILKTEDKELAKRGQALLKGATRRDGKWGKLKEVRKLKLDKQRKTEGSHSTRAQMCGTRIGMLHRLLTDGKAFKRKTTRLHSKGGTFLIDASGSMSIRNSHIAKILEKAPAALVAIYSASTQSGRIGIVAQDGRIASEETIRQFRDATGECNVIDGPALEWLGQQLQPRIWVCDGYVTGIGDGESANLTAEAIHITNKFNIKRLPNLEEAAKMA